MRKHPKGFTAWPEIKAIMDPYKEVPPYDAEKHGWSFKGLTVADAKFILDKVPSLRDEAQNDAPSFGTMVELGLSNPTMTFHGYIIGQLREDERISIEGFEVPIEEVDKEDIVLISKFHPNEFQVLKNGILRTWWD